MSKTAIPSNVSAMLATASANAEDNIKAESELGGGLIPAGTSGTCQLLPLEISIQEATDNSEACVRCRISFLAETPAAVEGRRDGRMFWLREDVDYKRLMDNMQAAGFPRAMRDACKDYQEILQSFNDWVTEESRTCSYDIQNNMSKGRTYRNVYFSSASTTPADSPSSSKDVLFHGIKVKITEQDGDVCTIEYLEGTKAGETKANVQLTDLEM